MQLLQKSKAPTQLRWLLISFVFDVPRRTAKTATPTSLKAGSLDNSAVSASDVRCARSVSYFLPECTAWWGYPLPSFRPATVEPQSCMRPAHPWPSVVDVRIARPGSWSVVGHPETDHKLAMGNQRAGSVGRCVTPADKRGVMKEWRPGRYR
jgi:hypothetical protein